jgi:hypothetical protein
MENIKILLPYAGQLTRRLKREAEVTSRLPKRRAFVQDRSIVQDASRSNYVVGINRPTERIYDLANVVAVVIMAVALVMAFVTCLTSLVGL